MLIPDCKGLDYYYYYYYYYYYWVRIPVGARFSTTSQTDLGAHQTYKLGTEFLSWGQSGRCVPLTTHPI